jgi:hypothetical protein
VAAPADAAPPPGTATMPATRHEPARPTAAKAAEPAPSPPGTWRARTRQWPAPPQQQRLSPPGQETEKVWTCARFTSPPAQNTPICTPRTVAARRHDAGPDRRERAFARPACETESNDGGTSLRLRPASRRRGRAGGTRNRRASLDQRNPDWTQPVLTAAPAETTVSAAMSRADAPGPPRTDPRMRAFGYPGRFQHQAAAPGWRHAHEVADGRVPISPRPPPWPGGKLSVWTHLPRTRSLTRRRELRPVPGVCPPRAWRPGRDAP